MPNWNVGTLKLRGKKDKIVNALSSFAPFIDVEVDDENGCIYLKCNGKSNQFEGVRRAFIFGDLVDEFYFEGDSDVIIVFDGVEIAWAMLPEHGWTDLSKAFDIAIRWHGFERGMQFQQDIEITEGGTITKNIEITHTNYEWDCPFPHYGG